MGSSMGSLWCGGDDNQETPLPLSHPLMDKYPANAQDYIGKALIDQAYLVIVKGEPLEVCGSFNEAIAILADELDDASEMYSHEQHVYYRQGDPNTPTGWISVVSLDVIDELGLLYLP